MPVFLSPIINVLVLIVPPFPYKHNIITLMNAYTFVNNITYSHNMLHKVVSFQHSSQWPPPPDIYTL